jgi:hypothetical protein
MEHLTKQYQNVRPPMQEMFELQRQRIKEQGYQEEEVTISFLRYFLSFFFSAIISSLILSTVYKTIFGLMALPHTGGLTDFLIILLVDALIIVTVYMMIYLACVIKFNEMGSKSLYFASSWKLGPYIYNAEPLTLHQYGQIATNLMLTFSLVPFILLAIFNTPLLYILAIIGFSISLCLGYYTLKMKKQSDMLILQVPNSLSILAFRK